ncbi:hypothetical protein GUJ93_ZPchr0006g43920 [Zizania palustris]|uniref:Uncharacterized protein n=1 Tax=Zizania palustris TaxID=103762 RepID=A0A8J5VJK5_ZIZPA|nr:hypothetical protein GUJ93_ZPchr0006g43920 [Zizania palustris]
MVDNKEEMVNRIPSGKRKGPGLMIMLNFVVHCATVDYLGPVTFNTGFGLQKCDNGSKVLLAALLCHLPRQAEPFCFFSPPPHGSPSHLKSSRPLLPAAALTRPPTSGSAPSARPGQSSPNAAAGSRVGVLPAMPPARPNLLLFCTHSLPRINACHTTVPSRPGGPWFRVRLVLPSRRVSGRRRCRGPIGCRAARPRGRCRSRSERPYRVLPVARRGPAGPGPLDRARRPTRSRSLDAIGSEDKSVENGSKAADVGQRQLNLVEECLATRIPNSQSCVHSVLFTGLALVT